MTAHEIHALSGAYAVDALDDLERARFEQHLSACAECQAEVASLLDAATMFSAVSEVAPPAAMRAKVLADIKSVRPLPPLVARLEERRPRRSRRWSGFVAAAAVFGILGGGMAVYQQANEPTTKTQLSAADQIITAADVAIVSKKVGDGRVEIYRSASLGKAALVTTNLPPAPSGKVYQLWLRKGDGHMVSAGLLAGSGAQKVVFDGDATGATGAGISVEPSGGSDNPTILYAVVPFEQPA